MGEIQEKSPIEAFTIRTGMEKGSEGKNLSGAADPGRFVPSRRGRESPKGSTDL